MILDTRRLFTSLLSKMQISVVCDVGSMNGQDALAFSAAAPGSSVYAFEPNPVNFGLMAADRALREHNICVVPLAASDTDGEAEFYLVEADYTQRDLRRGMSSLYARGGEWAPAAVVRVNTTRLDMFLAARCAADSRLALWIDTEGKAYEVIEGLSGVAQLVQLVHVEVETSACIGTDQKLYPEVKAVLTRLGFAELATDQAKRHMQFNALFVRVGQPADVRLELFLRLLRARLRYLVIATALAVFPRAARRYAAWRRRAAKC